MISSISNGGRPSAAPQIALAVVLSLAALPFLFSNPALVFALALLPFLPLLLRPAAVYLLVFICFSYFRLHEAYPILAGFSLPLVLGGSGTIAFAYAAFNSSVASKKPSKWQGFALSSTILAAGIAMTIVDTSAGSTLARVSHHG